MNPLKLIALIVLALAVGTYLAACEHANTRRAGKNAEAAT